MAKGKPSLSSKDPGYRDDLVMVLILLSENAPSKLSLIDGGVTLSD